jgi:hypothetical protein
MKRDMKREKGGSEGGRERRVDVTKEGREGMRLMVSFLCKHFPPLSHISQNHRLVTRPPL